MSRLIAVFFCLFMFAGLDTFAQGRLSVLGSLRITNYSPKVYGANPQIFNIEKDSKGYFYFANQRGLLQYDGRTWNKLELPNKREPLSSLVIDDGILVASTSGLGKWQNTDNGDLEFVDLTPKFSENDIPLSTVLKVGNKYFLNSLSSIFILDSAFNLIQEYSANNIGAALVIGEKVYFRGKNNLLTVYTDGEFVVHPVAQQLSNESIMSVVHFNNEVLVLTQGGTVYALRQFGAHTVYENKKLNIKTAIGIDDEFLSIGLYQDGVMILDREFDPVYEINIEKGLADGTILSQYVDNEKNLWLGTANGITKVDLLSPVITYNNLFSKSTVEDLCVLDNEIILATGGGAFILNDQAELSKIEAIKGDCYGVNVLSLGGGDTTVFISALNELYAYTDGQAVVATPGGPYNVKVSPLDSNELIVLHYDGVQLLRKEKGEYVEKKYVRDFCEGEPFNFVVTEKGDIWIGTKPNDGIYKLNVSDFGINDPAITKYDTKNGLPEGQTFLFENDEKIYVGTNKGVYSFDGIKFNKDNTFGKVFSEFQGVHRINKDPLGNIWMVIFNDLENTYEIGYSTKDQEGVYHWNSSNFIGYDENIVHSIFHENENITWLGGAGGVMSFDKTRIRDNKSEFESYIRRINIGAKVIYGGNGSLSENLVLDYSPKRLLEFTYSSNSFFAEEKTVYSYFLEGFDSEWSEWSEKTGRDYSLGEGSYVFKVKAKNIQGVESKVVSFSFEVLPPWYRTWWAYLIFAILFISVIIFIVKLSIRRIKQQNVKLEKIVKERTGEVVAQKAEAEKQRDFAEEQKHLVEEKNLEITDSINYAKRLQRAILTPVKTIQETFQKSFILYLPKDIVAGDFYWTNLAKSNNRNSRSLIAAADCTGHGVPGAMVSVVCSNALDRSVKEFGLIVPAKILDKVTDLVIETFEQSEDEVKDGMDIAICSYETKSDYIEVQYAGANNPLWVVRNQSQMIVNDEVMEPILANDDNTLFLFEVKATKQPVGKYAERKPFENNIVKLEEGDCVYTFTDGYADQFGGEKGKKYKYLPFKRFVLSMQGLTMEEQERALKTEFSAWQGTHDQIDDVCMIGIKL